MGTKRIDPMVVVNPLIIRASYNKRQSDKQPLLWRSGGGKSLMIAGGFIRIGEGVTGTVSNIGLSIDSVCLAGLMPVKQTKVMHRQPATGNRQLQKGDPILIERDRLDGFLK